jgi:hypothetical protein
MEVSFPLTLTEQQLYILQDLAKDHYRTLQNLIGMLITDGIQSYKYSHDYCVRKRTEDREGDKEFQQYSDEEIDIIFSSLPFLSTQSH